MTERTDTPVSLFVRLLEYIRATLAKAPTPPSASVMVRQVHGGLDPKTGRIRVPWGLLLHTSGRGVCALAKKRGESPIQVALRTYLQSQRGELHPYKWGGPAYVMDHDGLVYQIAPENVLTAHAGGPDRAAYMNGSWKSKCSTETVTRWLAKWPGYKSPAHLYPGRDPNQDYIGVEMIPCGSGFGQPMAPGLLFTREQHDAAVALARDVGQRNGFPAGWEHTPRFLGHEDVQPMQRQDVGGGWDPGFLRRRPYFDFEYVRGGVSR